MNEERKLVTLVVDDEASARDGLARMLAANEWVTTVNSCSNGIEAIKFLIRNEVDLLFLDIQMPLVDGFDVLRSIPPDRLPFVVFVTAYDEYAVKAFEFHALDYVLKPFTDSRLNDVINRVQQLIYEKEQVQNLEKLLEEAKSAKEPEIIDAQSENQLVFKENGVVRFLEQSDIDWIEAFDYYVKVHVEDKFHLVRTSIKKIIHSLSQEYFIRVHRSAIVNVREIASIDTKAGDWTITMKTGSIINVGRVFKDNLKPLLN